MDKFKYYIIFNSSATLEGSWLGTIEEFTAKFIVPHINEIYTYQIWLADSTDYEEDMVNIKREADMFDQMIEQHEQEELEKEVAERWAKQQFINQFYSGNPDLEH